MKIKIIKGIQYYFEEGDIIDTYTDEYCNSLIKNGLAISLEEKPKAIVGITEDIETTENKIDATKKQTKKAKKK